MDALNEFKYHLSVGLNALLSSLKTLYSVIQMLILGNKWASWMSNLTFFLSFFIFIFKNVFIRESMCGREAQRERVS